MTRSSHHDVACISRRQESEVFQSSRRSWSSKIIELGSVDSSHRTCGSDHDSSYSQVYSSKSRTWSPGGSVMSRRARIRRRVLSEVSSA